MFIVEAITHFFFGGGGEQNYNNLHHLYTNLILKHQNNSNYS